MDTASRAEDLVRQLTLEEKASLCSGSDFWTTQAVERIGIPAVTVTDGPHGVRLQAGRTDHLGLNDPVPATCFPTASALAATWDPDLIGEVGRAIADECLEFGVGVLLGPGANLKRSPLCGRNFEYFSEDPWLTGRLAAAFIDGVQTRGIGTSLKHLAANNQEFRRMTIDVIADERSLRELEFAGFEAAVRESQPWTVMCSYNRLNGTDACEHGWLLTDLLKGEWGHTGIVVTDWGAMNERVPALAAGCDLQMPAVDGATDAQIVAAVGDGDLDVEVLDAAAVRLVTLALQAEAARRPDATFDRDAHHALARKVAGEAAVLCRNVDDALPIGEDDHVALLGAFAQTPRYQGTGSSRIEPTRLDTLRHELATLVGEDRVSYTPGYDHPTHRDDDLITVAVDAASQADVAVVCVGLPDGDENEGDDRDHLRLPPTHDALVAAVAAAHDRVVVVLSNGAPVEMRWIDDVEAVVEGYLGGQAGAGGLADVLTGAVNPSGHLAETFPRHLDDVPSTRNFPGGPSTVEYREGLYVGYRFHDTVDGDVLFPFGHGLSYTSFAFGEPTLDRDEVAVDDLDDAEVTVTVPVSNTGTRSGRAVVQLYVRDIEAAVHRPDRELKAFAKVGIDPGSTTYVKLPLDRRSFAYWHPDLRAWTVEPGRFEVLVGASSRDLRGSASLEVTGRSLLPERDEPVVYQRPTRYLDVDAASFEALLGRPLPDNPGFERPYTRNTPIGATATSPQGKALVWAVERRLRQQFADDPANEALVRSMVDHAPLRTLLMGGVTEEELDSLVDLVNGRWALGSERLLRSLWERRPGGVAG
ncbi:MAG: glycosyl hydrolase [Nitriliruptor sp.]|nr:MAG: glycosyl hydrolase [Nitriliruptor sp.]